MLDGNLLLENINQTVCLTVVVVSHFIKVRLSPSKKISIIYLNSEPFKNDEKSVLFYLRSSRRSQGKI